MVSPFNKANVFDLTHEHLLTCNMGQLIPVELVEVVPGDTFKQHTDMFMRLEALIAPIMHRCDVKFWSFYVPNRTIMDGWESYITGGPDGTDTTVKPYMVAPEGGYAPGSLADHLGLPIGVGGYKHSALPIRMYQKIYNEWFRDENLIDEVALSTADGLDTTTSLDLQNVAWEKDYFTNALPTPQRGPASYLPLGTTAPVNITTGGDGTLRLKTPDGSSSQFGVMSNELMGIYSFNTNIQKDAILSYHSGLAGTADLSQATAVTVNQMRLAFQVQKFLEKNMRGGARLVEWTLSHFGVRIPDGRLQRSEFLGGGRSPVVISPVEQTSSTDATSPQGNLAGRGSSAQRTHKWVKSFVEQGYVMTLMTIVPRTLYSQGLHRLWSRETRYDEYVPVFAHLGEQEVLNKEIYTQGTDDDNGVFGYNDRFAELRHIPSTVHGQFRSGESLDYWTMARQFDSLPQLNGDFVTADPTRRVFAVTDESVDTIEVQVMHHLKAIRPLPKYGNPGLIDHD